MCNRTVEEQTKAHDYRIRFVRMRINSIDARNQQGKSEAGIVEINEDQYNYFKL